MSDHAKSRKPQADNIEAGGLPITSLLIVTSTRIAAQILCPLLMPFLSKLDIVQHSILVLESLLVCIHGNTAKKTPRLAGLP